MWNRRKIYSTLNKILLFAWHRSKSGNIMSKCCLYIIFRIYLMDMSIMYTNSFWTGWAEATLPHDVPRFVYYIFSIFRPFSGFPAQYCAPPLALFHFHSVNKALMSSHIFNACNTVLPRTWYWSLYVSRFFLKWIRQWNYNNVYIVNTFSNWMITWILLNSNLTNVLKYWLSQ